MEDPCYVTILIEHPSGFTVAGALLEGVSPFADDRDLADAVRAGLAGSWRVLDAVEALEYHRRRNAELLDQHPLWEQLRLL